MPGIKRKRQALPAKPKAAPKKKAASAAKKKAPAVKKAAPKPKKRDVKAQQKSAAKKTTKKAPPSDSDSEEEIVERKTAMSNGVMVDHCVPNAGNYAVAKVNGVVLNMHLMFADCGHNNNKFYIIQGLKCGSSCYLWTRWGRVGVDGQSALSPCGSEVRIHKIVYEIQVPFQC